MIVFLDAGPLSLITNPKRSFDTIAAAEWVYNMEAASHRFMVPATADYEVRRELVRAGKTRGVAMLNAFNLAESDRFISLSDSALPRAAELWARSRNNGTPTADPRELDGDVLIAAQAMDTGYPSTEFVIATTNLGHIEQFAPCDLWTNIQP